MKNNAVKNGQVLDMALYALARQTERYPVRRLNCDEIEFFWQRINSSFFNFMLEWIKKR